MSGLYFTDITKLKQAQKDLLWTQQVSQNELLTSSNVPALNQKLTTSSKRFIGAINELASKTTQLESTLAGNTAKLNEVVGNIFLDDSEELSRLRTVGDTVVDAVLNVNDNIEIAKADAIETAKAYVDGKQVTITRIDGGEF